MATIYVAGPMTSYPLWNFPAFDAARDRLLALGWTVISPADLDREIGFDETDPEAIVDQAFLDAAIRRDFEAIMRSDAIYMLKGWEQSVGATAEYWLARWRKLKVLREDPE